MDYNKIESIVGEYYGVHRNIKQQCKEYLKGYVNYFKRSGQHSIESIEVCPDKKGYFDIIFNCHYYGHNERDWISVSLYDLFHDHEKSYIEIEKEINYWKSLQEKMEEDNKKKEELRELERLKEKYESNM